MAYTEKQIDAAVKILQIFTEIVRDLGRVPQGHLYAAMMSHCSMAQFNRLVMIAVGSGLIRTEGWELVWVGPPAEVDVEAG